MLDQIRRNIQSRLDQLLAEIDKLRRALGALGSRPATPAKATPRLRAGTPGTPRAAARNPRPRPSAATRTPPPGTRSAPTRAAPGATKTAVLAALASGEAMTASQIAAATGLAPRTVSTTLSRLAKTGELTKAVRGYQLTSSSTATPSGQTPTGSPSH